MDLDNDYIPLDLDERDYIEPPMCPVCGAYMYQCDNESNCETHSDEYMEWYECPRCDSDKLPY